MQRLIENNYNLPAMYYDAHTHNELTPDNCIAVLNVSKNFGKETPGYCSMGLHPWYLRNDAGEFERLRVAAAKPNVIAIGECGLDKVCETEWELQVRIFRQQVMLANELKKPLIIHCVRAFNELIEILKICKTSVPVVIHGFNKKIQIAEQLLNEGYLLSFGTALLKSETTASVFKDIPHERYLLETDNSGLAIEEVYNRAAEIRETGIDSIILQAGHNFKTVFKI